MKNPKISIVTPSFNCGKYIEQTIKSVLNQDYDNFEYFVIDGGSKDNTIGILKKYSKDEKYKNKFHYISEIDKGQTHAINKGLKLSNGDWFAWINADDFYEPNIFSKLSKIFKYNSDAGVIYGNCFDIKYDKKILLNKPIKNIVFKVLKKGNEIYGPASFFNMIAIRKIGKFNENLKYWMDYDMYIKISKIMKLKYINMNIANFRIRPYQKSKNKKNWEEMQRERYRIRIRYDKKLFFKIFFNKIQEILSKIISLIKRNIYSNFTRFNL